LPLAGAACLFVLPPPLRFRRPLCRYAFDTFDIMRSMSLPAQRTTPPRGSETFGRYAGLPMFKSADGFAAFAAHTPYL